jgi:hypothetical protein
MTGDRADAIVRLRHRGTGTDQPPP